MIIAMIICNIFLVFIIIMLGVKYRSMELDYGWTLYCFREYFKNEKKELTEKYKKGLVTTGEYESYSSALDRVISDDLRWHD